MTDQSARFTRAGALLVGIVVGACAPQPQPLPDASLETRAAVMREQLGTARAEVMGGAFALLMRAQECPDAQLRRTATSMRQRVEVYYRAQLAYNPPRARTFEAHSRSMVVQLPPGPPDARLCARIAETLPDTERMLRGAGV